MGWWINCFPAHLSGQPPEVLKDIHDANVQILHIQSKVCSASVILKGNLPPSPLLEWKSDASLASLIFIFLSPLSDVPLIGGACGRF